jgi:glycosyltransferase involved in cell wall biosynthesis
MPTHHQSSFIGALRSIGFDVVVHYYDKVSPDRRKLGWHSYADLPDSERYVQPSVSSLSLCPDWRERVHILPGYARSFLIGLALRLSVQGVSWVHWSEPSRIFNRSWHGYLIRRFYGALVDRYALGALAIGDMARNDFIRWGIRPGRIHYLPYSVSPLLPDKNCNRGASEAGVRFLFVGALCHRKAIDVLLKAFAMLLSTHAESRLDLVGDDQADGEYQRLAADLRLGESVRFMPAVAAASISVPMSACDVLVLPSRFDGWGVVLNEATSLGKAVVATNTCGAAHHLVRHRESGFVVFPDDPAGLARAMAEYCHDRSLIERHGRESRLLFDDVRPERNALRFSEALYALLCKENVNVVTI